MILTNSFWLVNKSAGQLINGRTERFFLKSEPVEPVTRDGRRPVAIDRPVRVATGQSTCVSRESCGCCRNVDRNQVAGTLVVPKTEPAQLRLTRRRASLRWSSAAEHTFFPSLLYLLDSFHYGKNDEDQCKRETARFQLGASVAPGAGPIYRRLGRIWRRR
jgi:hypothetical protein